ncbi:MAG: type II toxin-antitoxin system Phd/YefM family antitoxin [bacterium]
MKKIRISDDIIPVGVFKTSISKYIKSLNETGHPLIITQNGRPAGVLISPTDYDNLVYKNLFINSVNRGLRDIESGNTFTTEQLVKEIKSVRALRNKK